MRNRTLHQKISLLISLLLAPALALATPLPELKPEPLLGYIEQIIAKDFSPAHYAAKPLNDELSREIFEIYLDRLDPAKIYFTRDDIRQFEKYRLSLDDSLDKGDVEPAYAIYNVLRDRMLARIRSVPTLLATKPDFSIKEEFRFDRDEADWESDPKALDEYWRKRVKNEVLGLLLADKSWEDARDLLIKRYANFERRIAQVNSEDVFEVFMNAYATSLDPHSSYMSPHDSEEFRIRMSLSYEGIGASLQNEDEYVKIVRLLPGGAAIKSNLLQPDDRITAVGQGESGEMVDVVGWRLDDVVDLIRGPKATTVRLQILPAGRAPGGNEEIVKLVRSEIQLEEQAASSDVIELPGENGKARKIGVITVPTFYLDWEKKSRGDEDYRSTTRDVHALIRKLQAENIDGLIIDLRNNGGGSLPEAIEMAGLFIDEGPVVQERYFNGRLSVGRDEQPGVAYDGPLVVMVNRFSASASEIFAGAIQDYRRGLVVGSTTFGKGTIQQLFDLNRFVNHEKALGQVKLTIGKFYRVTGSSTQHKGVIPDIQLPEMLDPAETGESAEPTALPWDEIQSAGERRELLVPALEQLPEIQAFVEQRKEDAELFQMYIDDIAFNRQLRNQTSVSLHLADRKAEQDRLLKEQLARLNELRVALGRKPVDSLEAAKADPVEYDALLNEAARIVVNYRAELTPKAGETRLADGRK